MFGISNAFGALTDSDDEEEEERFDEGDTTADEDPKLLFRLPDEVQVLVYAYLPHRIRLTILHERYPYWYYHFKLNRLPITIQSYYILHKYALSVYDLVDACRMRGSWFRTYGTVYDCIDWMNNVEELERRGNFSERVLSYENIPVKGLIMNAFRYYREIYLRDRGGVRMPREDVVRYEKVMVQLYAFVAGIPA